MIGAALAMTMYAYVAAEGWGGDTAPHWLWVWIALSGVAAVVLVAGWPGEIWWRRGASATALLLCLLSSALMLNLWSGSFPTVQSAWRQLTAGPLPDQTTPVAVAAIRQSGVMPPKGSVVAVNTGDTASGFPHRSEYVYLPPAWFVTQHRATAGGVAAPQLPTLLMIGGEFNTPADWLRAGDAVTTMDEFAAAHGGYAPVLVFADAGGTFNNDTECVNGPRGNAADHLTKDVVPYLIADFGVSPNPAHWGVVGWSMGGTCAVYLTVMHPELFSTFEDIAGDVSPNSGTQAQTVARLFGGSTAAWASSDSSTMMTRHGRYNGMSGWFDVNATPPGTSDGELNAANSLCSVATANGISCIVQTQPGQHDWPFASQAFAAALPRLTDKIGTHSAPTAGADEIEAATSNRR
ncbi:MAG: alpha/beta hydrolase-fold protein [Mycobacterium sp.]